MSGRGSVKPCFANSGAIPTSNTGANSAMRSGGTQNDQRTNVGGRTAASAGTSAASACRTEGWRVAIVDERPFGGTCALRGCDPKKVLIGGAEVIDWVRRMDGRGVEAPGARIDWPV